MNEVVKFAPFRELDRFFQDDVFMPIIGRMSTPAVDMYETANEVVAEVAIAGFDPKKVNVEIENNVLHIRGSEEQEVEDSGREYYRKEVRRGSFARSMVLPIEVDAEHVSAVAEKGVLKIVMPKSEKVKPRSINVDVKE